MQCLTTHQWQGNIRELQNIVFRVVANTQSNIITLVEVNLALSQLSRKTQTHPQQLKNELKPELISNWKEEQNKFEQKILLSLYPQYPTTRQLAERLGVSHNKIAMKLRKYRIKF